MMSSCLRICQAMRICKDCFETYSCDGWNGLH
jgi:hypothetical protein